MKEYPVVFSCRNPEKVSGVILIESLEEFLMKYLDFLEEALQKFLEKFIEKAKNFVKIFLVKYLQESLVRFFEEAL